MVLEHHIKKSDIWLTFLLSRVPVERTLCLADIWLTENRQHVGVAECIYILARIRIAHRLAGLVLTLDSTAQHAQHAQHSTHMVYTRVCLWSTHNTHTRVA